MRVAGILVFVCLIMTACDDQRVYENYVDFENRYWLVNEKPSFEFSIGDTTTRYNVYIATFATPSLIPGQDCL
jgi:hypothetical protein